MAALTAQSITEAGVDATYSAADSEGDTFANTSEARTFLHVKNGDSSSHTVTVTAVDASEDFAGWGTMTKSNSVVPVPAGEDRFIGPFPIRAFGNNPAVTYSAVTSVTVAALKVPSV